jgi:hypothetical protein
MESLLFIVFQRKSVSLLMSIKFLVLFDLLHFPHHKNQEVDFNYPQIYEDYQNQSYKEHPIQKVLGDHHILLELEKSQRVK